MSQTGGRFRRGLNARNTQIRDVRFLIKTLKKTWVNFLKTFSLHSLEKICLKVRRLLQTRLFFWENCFYSYIYISTLLFYYIHKMMINLYQTPPNMSSIGAVCDSLGQEQRKDNMLCLHSGRVQPESASSPKIINK